MAKKPIKRTKGPIEVRDSPRHMKGPRYRGLLRTDWWEDKGDAQAEGITQSLTWMFRQQNLSRLWLYSRNSALYSNLPFTGISRSIRRQITSRDYNADRLRMNVVASCVNTLTNHIGTMEPSIYWLADGGDYRLHRQAKSLTRFNNGILSEAQTYRKMRRVFRDAAGVFGDGFLYVHTVNGRICHERVPAYEIWVDEREAALAEPRTLHRIKNVSKSQLIAMYPDCKKEIEASSFLDPNADSVTQTIADLTTVRCSWHLGDKKDGSDGVFTISTDRGILSTKPYRHKVFPFVKFSFCERDEGWFSQSLTEQLAPMQLDVNRLCWVKQRNQHKMGGYKVWLHAGSAVAKNQLNNDFGTVIVSEQIPQYLLPPALQPEYYQDLAVTIQRMYDISGVNQSSAQGETADHLKSGEAIRADQQVGMQAMAALNKSWQDAFSDIAMLNVLVMQDMYDEGDKQSYAVRSPNRKTLDVIDWKDIEVDDLTCFWIAKHPISSLPQSPEAKWDQIAEWMQEQIIDIDEARELLELPDTAHSASLYNAQRERLEQILDGMVNEGDEITPDDFDNLKLGASMSLEYIARARRMGVPEDHIDLLRNFNRACNAKMAEAQAAAQQKAIATQQMTQQALNPAPPQGAPAPAQNLTLARPERAPRNVSLPFKATQPA